MALSSLTLSGIFFCMRGRWRMARYIPIFIIYLGAAYGNYVGGMGAPAMLMYVLAILLAAMVLNRAGQAVVAGLSLASYLLVACLKTCGYEVYTAPGAREGIDAFREHSEKIDLVLLDLSLPGMTGFEIFEELKAIDPGVCALLCSGFAEDDRIAAARHAGAAGFIHKPYDAKTLLESVSECVMNSKGGVP